MSKIYFGKNIKTQTGKFSDVFTSDLKSNLTDVYSLPTGLTNISNLFQDCINLKRVDYKLENTLTDISNVFYNCFNFSQDIDIPSSIEKAQNAFRASNIKNAMFNSDEKRGGYLNLSNCFKYCKNLDTVNGTIPNTVINLSNCFSQSTIYNTPILEDGSSPESIEYMFSHCKNMFKCNTKIPNMVAEQVSKNIFQYCNNLKSYDFDLNIYDGRNIFQGCSNLKSVGNLNGYYFNNAFQGCSNLKSVGNLNGCCFDNTFNNCSNLQSVGNLNGYNFGRAFQNCSNLQTIGNINGNSFYYTFYNCGNLQFISNINANYIAEAFNNCYNLEYIKINNVNSSRRAFWNCVNLKYVDIEFQDKGYINYGIFHNCNSLKIVNITPKGSLGLSDNFVNLNANCVINVIGKNHSIYNDYKLREILNTNKKPYYQSEYFNISNFINKGSNIWESISYNSQKHTSGESIYMETRYRTNPYNSSTEQQISYGNNTFSGCNFNIVYYMKGSVYFPNYCFNQGNINSIYTNGVLIGNNAFYNCNTNNIFVNESTPQDIGDNFFRDGKLNGLRYFNGSLLDIKTIGSCGFYNTPINESCIKFSNLGGTIHYSAIENSSFTNIYAPQHIFNGGSLWHYSHSKLQDLHCYHIVPEAFTNSLDGLKDGGIYILSYENATRNISNIYIYNPRISNDLKGIYSAELCFPNLYYDNAVYIDRNPLVLSRIKNLYINSNNLTYEQINSNLYYSSDPNIVNIYLNGVKMK